MSCCLEAGTAAIEEAFPAAKEIAGWSKKGDNKSEKMGEKTFRCVESKIGWYLLLKQFLSLFEQSIRTECSG